MGSRMCLEQSLPRFWLGTHHRYFRKTQGSDNRDRFRLLHLRSCNRWRTVRVRRRDRVTSTRVEG
jgi:hypothetical protein